MSAPRVNGRFILVGALTAVITVLMGTPAMICGVLGLPRRWLHTFSRIWARTILKGSGIEVELRGLEHLPASPAVLVGNHQGMFDILVLLGHLDPPPVFVAKHTLFWIPLFGQAMRAVGHIPVNRSHPDKAIASIQRGTQKLQKHGDHVVFFPEGTRTRNGQLLPFKKGAFVFAIESQLPLVPFAIEGSFRALPPGQRCLHRGMIRVKFLPPVDTTGLSRDDRDQLLLDTERQIGTALESLNTAEADYQRLGR